jgi:hypothetical protein
MLITDREDNSIEINPSAIVWMGFSCQWQKSSPVYWVIHLLGNSNILLKDDSVICSIIKQNTHSGNQQPFRTIQLNSIETISLNINHCSLIKSNQELEYISTIYLIDGTRLNSTNSIELLL